MRMTGRILCRRNGAGSPSVKDPDRDFLFCQSRSASRADFRQFFHDLRIVRMIAIRISDHRMVFGQLILPVKTAIRTGHPVKQRFSPLSERKRRKKVHDTPRMSEVLRRKIQTVRRADPFSRIQRISAIITPATAPRKNPNTCSTVRLSLEALTTK